MKAVKAFLKSGDEEEMSCLFTFLYELEKIIKGTTQEQSLLLCKRMLQVTLWQQVLLGFVNFQEWLDPSDIRDTTENWKG